MKNKVGRVKIIRILTKLYTCNIFACMSFEHPHENHDHSFWEELWLVFTDPAHVISEIAYNTIYLVLSILVIKGGGKSYSFLSRHFLTKKTA